LKTGIANDTKTITEILFPRPKNEEIIGLPSIIIIIIIIITIIIKLI